MILFIFFGFVNRSTNSIPMKIFLIVVTNCLILCNIGIYSPHFFFPNAGSIFRRADTPAVMMQLTITHTKKFS